MAPHAHLGYKNPVTEHDFPDPGVFYDRASQTWYAFGTNGNGKHIQCSYSKDFCSWTHHEHDCLPGPLPAWQSGQPNYLWAPEVVEAPQGRGGYLMYLSCQDAKHVKQCIGIAYSDHDPRGPYRWITDRPLISRGETGGTLDPQPFQDPVSGKRYLVYKSDKDKLYTTKNQLWLSELSPDGLSLVGDMHPLQKPQHGDQDNIIEAPYIVHHAPSGAYVLFFSAGAYRNGSYGTWVAISRNGLFGPYQRSSEPLLQTDKSRSIMGPGGACVVLGAENEYFIVFHALAREEGDRRMCIQRIVFANDGTPSLAAKPNCGRRVRLGAEQEDDMRHFGNRPSVPDNTDSNGSDGSPGKTGSGGKMSKLLNKVKEKLDS